MEFNANILDTKLNEIYPAKITIENGIFKNVEEIKDEKYSIDMNGILIPGLIDAHIHIESSMLIPSQFARAAVKHGVTSVICDPHEIANVNGKEGVEFMMENANSVPFNFYFGIPSCVPATPFETTYGILKPKEIEELMQKDNVVALAEMMNVPGVLTGDEEVIEKLKIAKKYNKQIDGHSPLLSGEDLETYLSYGISSDHECSNIDEVIEKASNGMKIFLRDGSSVSNLEFILNWTNILEYCLKLTPNEDAFFKQMRKIQSLDIFTAIVSDDKHPDHILDGYLKNSLLKTIKYGFDKYTVIQMLTSRPAEHYNLNEGVIEKGKNANFFVVDNLKNFNVKSTYINGECVYDGKDVLFEASPVIAKNSINCDLKEAKDFEIYSDKEEVKVNVIGAIENSLITEKEEAILKTENGVVQADLENDILKIAVVERYGGNTVANAFVSGFGFNKGSIGSSVAHDSHNIVVVGTNSEDMARVTNIIRENKGGLAIACEDFESSLALPIAGLMSDKSAEEVAENMEQMRNNLKELNPSLTEPFMISSFLALLVIPHIKLSDKGLFDGDNFEFMDVIIE